MTLLHELNYNKEVQLPNWKLAMVSVTDLYELKGKGSLSHVILYAQCIIYYCESTKDMLESWFDIYIYMYVVYEFPLKRCISFRIIIIIHN